jgi:hypothetical protein
VIFFLHCFIFKFDFFILKSNMYMVLRRVRPNLTNTF